MLSSANGLESSVTLSCRLHNTNPSENLPSKWTVQNKVFNDIISTFVSRDGYTANQFHDGQTQLMYLTINSLSYKHTGRYYCHARESISDPSAAWISASINLSLKRMYIIIITRCS